MTFRKLTFNFESEEDIDFYLEFLLTAGLKYVRLHKQLQADFENQKNEIISLKGAADSEEIKREQENKLKKPISSLEAAKHIMGQEGYVFYKYKKPTAALKQRRHRRTKAEMQEAGLAIRK